MPKIQAEEKLKNVPFTVKIREDFHEKIVAYCHYLNPQDPSSPGYVLTECFKQAIDKDAEFAAFLKTFQPKPVGKAKKAAAAKA